MIAQLGVRIRVSGALHLLPRSVQEAAYKAMESTKHHDKATLNICCPYTSRNEISQTMSDILEAHSLGLIQQDDMDQDLLDRSLFIGDLPALEVLVRTSGEIRLSDYMLWQASEDCVMHFVDTLWPEFGFMDMLKIILSYQMHCLTQRLFTSSNASPSETPALQTPESQKRIDDYLVWLREKRMQPGPLAQIQNK
jgi:ditrans,polycis-polyprenyl diphosphate synthase